MRRIHRTVTILSIGIVVVSAIKAIAAMLPLDPEVRKRELSPRATGMISHPESMPVPEQESETLRPMTEGVIGLGCIDSLEATEKEALAFSRVSLRKAEKKAGSIEAFVVSP